MNVTIGFGGGGNLAVSTGAVSGNSGLTAAGVGVAVTVVYRGFPDPPDDGPAGVREPRRPLPPAPSTGAVREHA